MSGGKWGLFRLGARPRDLRFQGDLKKGLGERQGKLAIGYDHSDLGRFGRLGKGYHFELIAIISDAGKRSGKHRGPRSGPDLRIESADRVRLDVRETRR